MNAKKKTADMIRKLGIQAHQLRKEAAELLEQAETMALPLSFIIPGEIATTRRIVTGRPVDQEAIIDRIAASISETGDVQFAFYGRVMTKQGWRNATQRLRPEDGWKTKAGVYLRDAENLQ